jgi:hypothetical protein
VAVAAPPDVTVGAGKSTAASSTVGVAVAAPVLETVGQILGFVA